MRWWLVFLAGVICVISCNYYETGSEISAVMYVHSYRDKNNKVCYGLHPSAKIQSCCRGESVLYHCDIDVDVLKQYSGKQMNIHGKLITKSGIMYIKTK